MIGVIDCRGEDRWAGHWSRYGSYIAELLAHAGLPHRFVTPATLGGDADTLGLVIIPSHLALNDAERRSVARFVEEGGVVVGLGGTSGLDELFGCRGRGRLEEGWVVRKPPHHAVVGGVGGALHAVGGHLVELLDEEVQVIAEWLDPEDWSDEHGWERAVPIGPAITVHRCGTGWALLIGPDLVHTVLRIQQGIPVHVDGRPAPDGSAPVDDGILKADDGLVLDYERDRCDIGGAKVFGRPVTDEWRELLVRAVLWAARLRRVSVPMLWYWPRELPAVAQISHDTDHNIMELAEILHDCMNSADIKSTWCVQYPGGYRPDFYQTLAREGHEIALHYDAHSDRSRTTWSRENFDVQLDWLRDIAGVEVVSNKNHYLRWEGLTEFFGWLERRAVASDQSKGPTKLGNNGFPFGGAHPWFPLDEHRLRPFDVVEVNHQTWELVARCPYELGTHVIDQAGLFGGVAHFLFHPGMIRRPGVEDALKAIIKYGKDQGVEWWTNRAIQEWERKRRSVRFRLEKTAAGEAWVAESSQDLEAATVLLFDPAGAQEVSQFGYAAKRRVLDLEAGVPTIISSCSPRE